jgi:ABC-type Fe3+-hydroxamate transport system substrate-binding protein
MRACEAEEPLEQYAAYYADLVRKTEKLPPTVLVTAGDDVDLHRLFASF